MIYVRLRNNSLGQIQNVTDGLSTNIDDCIGLYVGTKVIRSQSKVAVRADRVQSGVGYKLCKLMIQRKGKGLNIIIPSMVILKV